MKKLCLIAAFLLLFMIPVTFGWNRIVLFAASRNETAEDNHTESTYDTTYIYDKNDRLISEETNGLVAAYTYDNNGNITT